MATEGTPYQGLDYAAGRIYGAHLSLVGYSNAANSLGDSSVYADLTFPTSTGGYAPIALDGTWSSSNGTVTYLTAGVNPGWVVTGTWSATVVGVAIVDIANAKLLHFRDNSIAFTGTAGKRLEVDVATLVT